MKYIKNQVQKCPEKNNVLNKTAETIEFDELSFFFERNRLKNRVIDKNVCILFF